MTLKGKNYEITAKNLICHELIGLGVRVKKSSDPKRANLHGTVVDETKNLVIVEKNGEEKKVPKNEVVLEFDVGNELVEVEGSKILFAPENRTKALWRIVNG